FRVPAVPTGPQAVAEGIALAIKGEGMNAEVFNGASNYPTEVVANVHSAHRVTYGLRRGIKARRVPLRWSHDSSAAKRIADYVPRPLARTSGRRSLLSGIGDHRARATIMSQD